MKDFAVVYDSLTSLIGDLVCVSTHLAHHFCHVCLLSCLSEYPLSAHLFKMNASHTAVCCVLPPQLQAA